MLNDLFDVFGGLSYSQSDAGWAAKSAESVHREQGSVKADLSELENRLNHLTLICMAMWSLMTEKTSLTAEDLAARVRQIDLADGKEDGKVARTIKTCRKCNRVMSPRHSKCLYCGSADLSSDPFSAVM